MAFNLIRYPMILNNYLNNFTNLYNIMKEMTIEIDCRITRHHFYFVICMIDLYVFYDFSETYNVIRFIIEKLILFVS